MLIIVAHLKRESTAQLQRIYEYLFFRYLIDVVSLLGNFVAWHLLVYLIITLVKTSWERLKIQSTQEMIQFFKIQILPLTLGWEGYVHWKIDFLFCLNSFVQDCRSKPSVNKVLNITIIIIIIILLLLLLLLLSLTNRSDILCHNFVSNSPEFYFSGIYLSKNCHTKSQNNCHFTLKPHHAMVAPFFPQYIMQPVLIDIPALTIWYRSIRSMSDSQLDIQTASHFLRFSLVDQLHSKGEYFCSFFNKFNQACTKYSLKCIQQCL